MNLERSFLTTALACLAVSGCSSSTAPATGSNDGGGGGSSDSGVSWDPSGSAAPPNVPASNAQTPPTNGAAVRAWLEAGSYKTWHCEPAPHASRSPSPHNMNRICANDLSSAYAAADGGAGERPEGTAAVKELYDATGTTIRGYAVYLKAAATSSGGASWYWYESDPTVPASIRDSMDVIADGFGGSGGGPNGICVSCHSAAGSNAAHTPTPGSSDFVYTQVQ
jgi:hypothetical protein